MISTRSQALVSQFRSRRPAGDLDSSRFLLDRIMLCVLLLSCRWPFATAVSTAVPPSSALPSARFSKSAVLLVSSARGE